MIRSKSSTNLLENNNTDITTVGSGNYTALHLACGDGHETIVKYLLCHPKIANMINRNTKDGWTPLSLAIAKGSLEIVKMLLAKNANIEVINKFGETVLYSACKSGQQAIVEVLLNDPRIKSIINKPTQLGYTSVMIAAASGFLEIVKMLLRKNANIEHTSHNNGATALHLACQNGHKDIVEHLLSHPNIGNMINQETKYKWTPLSVAIAKGFLEIVEMLLNKGADIKQQSENGQSILLVACNYQRVHKTKDIVKLLLEQPQIDQIINQPTETGYTPLMMIANTKDFLEIVQILLNKNADIEQKSNRQETVLYIACKNRQRAVVELLLRHPKINNIIDQATNEGNTPLIIAAKKGFLEIVEMLVNAGANTELKNNKGGTALVLANRLHHTGIVELLSNKSSVLTFSYKPSSNNNVNHHKETSNQKLKRN